MKKAYNGKIWRTKEEKLKLIKKWYKAKEQGMKIAEFSKENGLHPTAIYGWIHAANKVAAEPSREIVPVPSNGSPQELKLMKVENQRLRMIVADQCLDIQALKEYAGRS